MTTPPKDKIIEVSDMNCRYQLAIRRKATGERLLGLVTVQMGMGIVRAFQYWRYPGELYWRT